MEEKVQVDLLQTLKRLRAPMIAYDETMKWAARSCLQGYVFRDDPTMSRNAVIEKLKSRVDLDSLRPMVKQLYLPYSKRFVHVNLSARWHPFSEMDGDFVHELGSTSASKGHQSQDVEENGSELESPLQGQPCRLFLGYERGQQN